MASSSPSSSSSSHFRFDVFLSFNGGDTRHNFVSHLYKNLVQKGINTFKDDERLNPGKHISSEIKKVIRESRVSIVVFSENYASSTWCLDELVEIIQFTDEEEKHIVLPIFREVDPSHVRHQRGSFAEDLAEHEENFPNQMEEIQNWRSALTKAASVCGYDSRGRDETNLIEEIAIDVLNKLSHMTPKRASGLVGMVSRVKKIESLLAVGLNDVRMIGICGMGGIGKTTIARQVYQYVSYKFDGFCFIDGVREAVQRLGHSSLQKGLLSTVLGLKNWDKMKPIEDGLCDRCVLIVLDDVDNQTQLETLAGKHEWFGPGSRIIITSRDRHLLKTHRVDELYMVEHLTPFESLKLFNRHAFVDGQATNHFIPLSQHVVNYAQGLPLAIKVLGSALFDKSLPEWQSELNKLRVSPPEKLQNLLRISFDGLDGFQKKMFLDIACFFNGDHVDKVTDFFESCGVFPVAGLRSLCDKSLLSIVDNKISMHELLQEMGWGIVRQESDDLGKRSRLWDTEDVHQLLAEEMGTEAVEGITLDLSKIIKVHYNSEAFSRLTKLRLLKICYVDCTGGFEYPCGNRSTNSLKRMDAIILPNLHLFGRFTDFSNELRCLHWHGYPLKHLPSKFYPHHLVELNMSYSHIKNFWDEAKRFDKLKFINLCNSTELVRTPDLTEISILEILILEGCTNLIEVHPSIGLHKSLVVLNLRDCKTLHKFLTVIEMRSLKLLFLSGCSKFEAFPIIKGYMQRLSELLLDGTAIKELPMSVGMLTGLEVLSATNCECLTGLPTSICTLNELRILNLSGCLLLKSLPENLGLLENLEELRVDKTGVVQPPTSTCLLNKLKVLSFSGCRYRQESPSNVQAFLRKYFWRGGSNLCEELPASFSSEIFVGLSSLTNLDLGNCNLSDEAVPYVFLELLRKLDLSGNNFSTLPYSICELPNLEVLRLAGCKNLLYLPALPSTIYSVDASNCCSLIFVQYPSGVNESCTRSFSFMNCSSIHPSNFEGAFGLLESHLDKMPLHSYAPVGPLHKLRVYSAKVKLPSHWYNNTFRGLVLCVVFEVEQQPLSTGHSRSLDFELRCNDHILVSDNGFTISRDTLVESDHLWFRYFPSPLFKLTRLRGDSWSAIEAFLKTSGSGLRVKEYGLYPLYWDGKAYTSSPEPDLNLHEALYSFVFD